MEGFIFFGLFIAVPVSFCVNWFIASFFEDVAWEKGFKQKRYFWVPFLFGIVGYLLVVALPDRNHDTKEGGKPLVDFSEERQTRQAKWTCQKCGTENPHDMIRCKCGADRPEDEQ